MLTADLAAIVLGVAISSLDSLVTEFVQEPRTVSYGLGASTLVASLCLVPFSVMGLLASRTAAPITKRLSASVVLVGGSLVIAAAGGFFALLHGTVWEAFVAMGVIGVGCRYICGDPRADRPCRTERRDRQCDGPLPGHPLRRLLDR